MAAHKGSASSRPRFTRSGSSVAVIPDYQSTLMTLHHHHSQSHNNKYAVQSRVFWMWQVCNSVHQYWCFIRICPFFFRIHEWKYKQHISPKHSNLSTKLNGMISQNTTIMTPETMRTWNLEKCPSPVITTSMLAQRIQYICGNTLKAAGTVWPKQNLKPHNVWKKCHKHMLCPVRCQISATDQKTH
jgi:hypothetical protein